MQFLLKHKFVIGILLFLIVIPLAVILIKPQETKTNIPSVTKVKEGKITSAEILQITPIATPFPLTFTPKIYQSKEKNYLLKYPSDWEAETYQVGDNPSVSNLYFSENGQNYLLSVSMRGDVVPESYSKQPDEIQNKSIMIGKNKYVQSIWVYQNNPYFILAAPVSVSDNFPTFSLSLPDTNQKKYIDIFDEIVTNTKIF